jgi:hypothetical protein
MCMFWKIIAKMTIFIYDKKKDSEYIWSSYLLLRFSIEPMGH